MLTDEFEAGELKVNITVDASNEEKKEGSFAKYVKFIITKKKPKA
jgi:hypothetical protein